MCNIPQLIRNNFLYLKKTTQASKQKTSWTDSVLQKPQLGDILTSLSLLLIFRNVTDKNTTLTCSHQTLQLKEVASLLSQSPPAPVVASARPGQGTGPRVPRSGPANPCRAGAGVAPAPTPPHRANHGDSGCPGALTYLLPSDLPGAGDAEGTGNSPRAPDSCNKS